MTHSRYVNFFTDFAFKRLFGSEVSKPILLDFLNELLYQEQGRIVSLTYLKNEHIGRSAFDRKAIYDLYCENERGEKFIVEIQRAYQEYFKDRMLFYSTFPIVEQAPKAQKWNFQLTPVYIVAILDFVFDDDINELDKYRYDIKLADIDTGKVFYDKLTFIYLAMPKFTKTEVELTTRFEKWIYILKNLPVFERVPDAAREAIFEEFFHLAEVAQLSPEDRDAYDTSIKVMWDNYAVSSTALKQAEARGKAEGLAEGEVKALCDTILRLLVLRFGNVPKPLSEKLRACHSIDALHVLTAATVTSPSLAAFEATLEEQMKGCERVTT